MALGKMKKQQFEAPKLQITSMMDMFTIILIFLLFSFSDKPDTVHLEKDFRLPTSVTQQDYKENIKLVLSQTSLRLEGELVASLKDGHIVDLDPHNLNESRLYQQLRLYREKADKSKADEKKKKQILFLCDKRLPFNTINYIIKTAALAGYPNFQFAVLQK